MFDTDDLALLLRADRQPCVSLFMFAHRAGPETREDPIRFGNLLGDAQRQLEDIGIRAPDARALLQPATAMRDDPDPWRHQDQGLAVFAAPDFFRHYTVPLPLDELAVVSDRFHVKPLVPLLARDGLFYLLSFHRLQVRLFEGSRFALREIPTEQLPEGLLDVMEKTELQADLGFHPTGPTPTTGGTPTAKYHSLGESPDDYLKTEIVEFVRQLARAMGEHLAGSNKPLVLAAEDQLQGIYRGGARYAALVEEGIDKNPAGLNLAQLHRHAYSLVVPLFDKEREQGVERFRTLVGTGDERASTDLEAIVPAARFGRVDTLFVATDRQCWGQFDEAASAVIRHDTHIAGDDDLLDLATADTLTNGGTVYAGPQQDVPGGGPAASILRY